MRPIPLLGVLAMAAGCAPDPGSPLSRLDPSGLSGSWRVTESMHAAAFDTRCEATTDLVLHREGSAVSGRYAQSGECRDRFMAFDNSGEGEIRAGQVHAARANGDVVTWDDGTCAYTGVLSGGRMAGTVRCVLASAGQRFEFNGRWRARRVPDLAVHAAKAADQQPDSCPGAETPALYGRIPQRDGSSQTAPRT